MKAVISVLIVFIAAAAEGNTYYCEGRGSAKLDNRKQASTIKAWLKSPSTFRIVETVNGRDVVTICEGVHIWLLSPSAKKGVHRIRTPKEVAATNGMLRIIGDDVDGFRKQGAQRKGRDTIGGVSCDLYELKKEGLTHHVWVIPGPDRLTKKRESFGTASFATTAGAPMQRHSISRQMTYDWKINPPMPDRLFKVPAGYKIQETQAAPPPVFDPNAGKRP